MSRINYADVMGAVAQALAEVAPDRVITRTFKDFEQRDEATELVPGIYTITFAGVVRYPWDRCDQHDGEGPTATAFPVFRFRITGQRVLDARESDDGAAVEEAEFELLTEIEQLADRLVSDSGLPDYEELCRVVLKNVVTSEQLESPYAWVSALFEAEITG